MFPLLALLPPLAHKEAICTRGYPIASKLVDYRVFKLDMTYFEIQDGQLKLTSKFKKR